MQNIENLKFSGNASGIFSILRIREWVSRNLKHYEYCKENNFKLNSCFHDLGCTCSMNSQESNFVNLYDSLNQLTELHRFEKYAKKELISYQSIIYDKIKIKEWLIKNERFASQDLACFLVDYLDYSENESDIHDLLAYKNSENSLDIFIQRSDFENLIGYKEVFDELYYLKKMYPEGIKRIEEEINKLPKYLS